ncbi:MAG: HD domain-containing protein [Anaerolineae bacterium]
MISVGEARDLYDGADAVHDFDHVLRVLRLAEHLARTEGAKLPIVRAATLLHDVGRRQAVSTGADHARVSVSVAREVLAGQPARDVEAIVHAIAAHRFRTQPQPSTLEAKVLFDADKLDAIGAVGVARAFAYAGAHGQRLWVPMTSVDFDHWVAHGDDANLHTPVHEFVVKLSRVKDRLFTETGRKIAAERHDTMNAFFQRLSEEVRGLA